MTRYLPPLGRILRALGAVAAVLALVGRLVSGGMAADPRVLHDAAALLAVTVQCDAATPAAAPAHHHPIKPGPERALLALASLLAQAPPALAADAVPIPAPSGGELGAAASVPPARAPPPRRLAAALPRGPPVLA